MPAWPQFCGPAYRLESPNVSCDRIINGYVEIAQQGPRAGTPRIREIYGLKSFITLPGGFPLQCLWADTGGQRLFAISGGILYEVFQDPATPPVAYTGSVGISTNPAIITSNGFQLAISSAGQAYIASGVGTHVDPINFTTGGPVNAATIAFQDGYFIGAIGNSKQIYISRLAPDGGTWDPGDTAFKEGYADNIVRAWVDQPGGTYLWLFGNDTYEVWQDTGALFPFQRVPSQVYPIGCDSAWAVAGIAGMRFWLWRGSIYKATGFQATIVSDYGVERAIRSYSAYDQNNAEAFCYKEEGRVMYVISFPESGACWGYDDNTKMWHERLYFANGVYTRYRPRVYAFLWNTHFVGDYQNSRIYIMQPETFTDADIGARNSAGDLLGPAPLRRERIAPYITDQIKNTRFNRLTLDVDTGVGLSVAPGQPGYDPTIVMKYSANRGKTWSSERSERLGGIGEDLARVFWTQMGSSRIGFTADVWCTDPVPLRINNAFLDTDGSTWPRN